MRKTTALTLPDCHCDLEANRRYHSDECQAAYDAYTDALLIAAAADAQAAAATTVEEIDAAVDALRAVPVVKGRNSRPMILALLRRRRSATTDALSINGPAPCDWLC